MRIMARVLTRQDQRQQQQQQQEQGSLAPKCSRANYVIDIQGFRDSKDNFLPKEVAVLSTDARILRHWMIEAPYGFDTLPPEVKVTNNYCTLHLHGIEWYDGDAALGDVRAELRTIGRQAHKIFARGFDKVKYLESLLGRRIVNIEDYENSIKYSDLEKQFGGGLYCSVHGFEEQLERRMYCALHRAHLLSKWLTSLLDEYQRDRPESAQGDFEDFHSALYHMEQKSHYVEMSRLDKENEYVNMDSDVSTGDHYEDYDDGENPYEIPGEPVTAAAATSETPMTRESSEPNKVETNNDDDDDDDDDEQTPGNGLLLLSQQEPAVVLTAPAVSTSVDEKKDNVDDASMVAEVSNSRNKRSPLRQQQPPPTTKNPIDEFACGQSKVKRRIDFCCLLHKQSFRNKQNKNSWGGGDEDICRLDTLDGVSKAEFTDALSVLQPSTDAPPSAGATPNPAASTTYARVPEWS